MVKYETAYDTETIKLAMKMMGLQDKADALLDALRRNAIKFNKELDNGDKIWLN